jgi:hypothetical protein
LCLCRRWDSDRGYHGNESGGCGNLAAHSTARNDRRTFQKIQGIQLLQGDLHQGLGGLTETQFALYDPSQIFDGSFAIATAPYNCSRAIQPKCLLGITVENNRFLPNRLHQQTHGARKRTIIRQTIVRHSLQRNSEPDFLQAMIFDFALKREYRYFELGAVARITRASPLRGSPKLRWIIQ